MTICEPFRFWTNEMRVTNVIRERCFRLILACVVCTLLVTMESHPANAAVADPSAPADEADRFSMECLMATGASGDETLKILFDPHTTDVFRIHLKLSFDPTQFKLDPSQSGPFCSFADGGMPCPQRPPVELGKKTEIPQIAPSSESGISEKRIARERFVKDNTFNPGIPPPGSILSFSEPTSGHVVVDYILPAPVNLSIDQIVFALALPSNQSSKETFVCNLFRNTAGSSNAGSCPVQSTRVVVQWRRDPLHRSARDRSFRYSAAVI